jgi:hypothetical protein
MEQLALGGRAGPGALEPKDLGSEIGQDHAPERAGPDAADLEHPDM